MHAKLHSYLKSFNTFYIAYAYCFLDEMLNIIPVPSVCISTPAACDVTAASTLSRKLERVLKLQTVSCL